MKLTSEELARTCARFAADKKAEDLVVLDLRGISTFADFFVVCSGTSDPHLKAISGSIREGLRDDFQVTPLAVDGYPASQWMILDYIQVIVHVFHAAKRDFYDLETLWNDAPRLKIDAPEPTVL
ncbi:MAG TPA: ribosome silencing factor [Chthoniobacterales bacterium]